jgi:hypothetical protein
MKDEEIRCDCLDCTRVFLDHSMKFRVVKHGCFFVRIYQGAAVICYQILFSDEAKNGENYGRITLGCGVRVSEGELEV